MLSVFFITRKKEAGISSRRFREDFPSHQGDPIISVEIESIIAYSSQPDKGGIFRNSLNVAGASGKDAPGTRHQSSVRNGDAGRPSLL